MSAEEVFQRFAGRVLFLTCDESADEYSLASGVLVSADGLILTNAHVVADCRSMRATYIHGTARQSYEPVLKSYDDESDTAVLKISGRGLDFFSLPSRPARVGERVYTIGNPRGLEQSISEGIVSGNREEDGVSWIQHSAPISPGSSGGALISSHGELLGINSRFRKDSQNLNFAVPATTLAMAISGARSVVGSVAFPANRLTGKYSGILRDEMMGEPQEFTILVREGDGSDLQGCVAVKVPNVGSGYLRGRVTGPQLSFDVVGDILNTSFSGQRNATDLSGSYSSSSSHLNMREKGTFVLHKESSEGPPRGFNIMNCPGDVALARDLAEQGNATAQTSIAEMYEEGLGVPEDQAQAARWFRKAAEYGDATAQVHLGVQYEKGRGVPQDSAQAAAWFRKAAEQGDAAAEELLGMAYGRARGVPLNYVESYFWIKLAILGELPTDESKKNALAFLDKLATHLTPLQVAQVQARVREWLASHPNK